MTRLVKRAGEKASLWKRIKDVMFTDATVLMQGLDEDALERLEELLLASDFGVPSTMRLVDRTEALIREGRLRTEQDFRNAVVDEITEILSSGDDDAALHFAASGLTVFLIVGVNGVGKTTTIGKLANRLKKEKHRPLLAAADTFRAGAIEQLRVWSQRVGCEFVGGQQGADPASVAFDAIDAAHARNADVLIIDTAGRLHTQDDLMSELAKVQRVVSRKVDGAPHETLLVLDATVGQNAVAQARLFGRALPLTGLALAKLDSTAKGGIVVALKQEFDLPVKLVGTGEKVGDLEPFDARRFAEDVLSG
jgi:fused signal recognition particle receptor